MPSDSVHRETFARASHIIGEKEDHQNFLPRWIRLTVLQAKRRGRIPSEVSVGDNVRGWIRNGETRPPSPTTWVLFLLDLSLCLPKDAVGNMRQPKVALAKLNRDNILHET